MQKAVLFVLAATTACGSIASGATVTTFNTNLTTTGWNVGTGQSNGNFKTVNYTTTINVPFVGNRAAGVELGLRASLRFVGAIADANADGIYYAPTGVSALPDTALWNFDYSVNLTGAFNTLNTSNWLYVDLDPSAATNFVPVNLNATYLLRDPVQDSQNFGFYSPPLPFNPNTPGTYDIALATFRGNTIVASNFIQIVVADEGTATAVGVPLPTAAMSSGALLALTALRRRR